MPIKLDPRIARAVNAAVADIFTSLVSAAADAALGEVEQRLHDGAEGISRARGKVRKNKKRRSPEVIEATVIDEPRGSRRR